MRNMKKTINLMLVITAVISTSFVSNLSAQTVENNQDERQELIIETYLKNGAWNHHFLSKEWDQWINLALQQDSTIAYLWQQKALPYWKQKKYQLAVECYENAVKYDRKEWLSRLGFLKCIFAKDYEGALIDLNNYSTEFGLQYEQDHPLDFYKGLCFLQLNQFQKACDVFKEIVENQERKHGADWVHYLERYYYAISNYELKNYQLANRELDKVLKEYNNFSDAQYYKALCMNYLGEKERAKTIMELGKLNFENGYTFNEDSNRYEDYPYQITWQWAASESLLK